MRADDEIRYRCLTAPHDVPTLAYPIALRAQLGDPDIIAGFLRRPGVLRRGHFQLLSGLHTEDFLAFSQIAIDTKAVRILADLLAAVAAPWQADGVLAPSTAGVALAGALAERLGVGLHLAALNDRGRPEAVLGAARLTGRRMLLVNDVVTTGQGLRALATVVRAAGAEVAGAAWFASRATVSVGEMIGAPVAWIASLQLEAITPERCHACRLEHPLADALDLN